MNEWRRGKLLLRAGLQLINVEGRGKSPVDKHHGMVVVSKNHQLMLKLAGKSIMRSRIFA